MTDSGVLCEVAFAVWIITPWLVRGTLHETWVFHGRRDGPAFLEDFCRMSGQSGNRGIPEAMTNPTLTNPANLLADLDFVKRLAHGLCGDEHIAEDVATLTFKKNDKYE